MEFPSKSWHVLAPPSLCTLVPLITVDECVCKGPGPVDVCVRVVVIPELRVTGGLLGENTGDEAALDAPLLLPLGKEVLRGRVMAGAGIGRGRDDCAPRGEDTGEGLALLL